MSNVYITGDTHGDFSRIDRFCQEHYTNKADTMIILGDAGINYFGDERDAYLKNRLDKMPISFFCIHGNHEMRPHRISEYSVTRRHGGNGWCEQAHQSLFFAADGEVFEFNGKKCLVIGGAYSVDKNYRLSRGRRWFPDEQPDDQIKRSVESSIKLFDGRFDIVLSHTCPYKYIPREMFLPGIDQSTVDDSTERWLDGIEDALDYDHWLCGHYHTDKSVDKMRFMFGDIISMEVLYHANLYDDNH